MLNSYSNFVNSFKFCPIFINRQRIYNLNDTQTIADKQSSELITNLLDGDLIKINDTLNIFKLNFRLLKPEKISKRQFYELVVQDTKTDKIHNIEDLGYGISRLLFLLSTLLRHTKDSSTVFIEEPESHLHPDLQGMFLDFVISVNDGSSNFVLDTHSEIFNLALSKNVIHQYKTELSDEEKEFSIKLLQSQHEPIDVELPNFTKKALSTLI